MPYPKISIVTPSYNQGDFIEETILSVLEQNYPNLEYIIIDGGSTDQSVEIIKKYSKYLTYWVSEKDNGQSHAINKGIAKCTGNIFNWLNSDDYLENGSLKKIAEVFEEKEYNIICGYTRIFDTQTNDTTLSYRMKIDDSVAKTIMKHLMNQPGSFYKLSVIRELGYINESLRYVMDLELWFRFLLHYGISNLKLVDFTIAHFRHHSHSKTIQEAEAFRQEEKALYYNLARTIGVDNTILKALESYKNDNLINLFPAKNQHYKKIEAIYYSDYRREVYYGPNPRKILFTYLKNGAPYFDKAMFDIILKGLLIGRKNVEWLKKIVKPFKKGVNLINLVRFFSRLSRLKKIAGFYSKISHAEIIFFFPFYHLGGAEKVHAQICHCFKDKKCTIIFTKPSNNDGFKSKFPQEFTIIDLNDFNLSKYNLLITSILKFFINRNPRLILFGANSVFFYNLIPYLKPGIKKIDLIHANEGGIAEYSLSRVHLFHWRVIISSHIRDYLANLYQSAQIDPQLLTQIVHIPNFVPVPASFNPLTTNQLALKIIFVGRNSPEKRIHLIRAIAQQCYLEKLAVEFSLVGDFEDQEVAPNIRFIAPIYDEDKLYALYQTHSIFMLTSRNEGLPMSLMEAMANGLIPICTQVGGIEQIIQNQENGFLLNQPEDEDWVLAQALECLSILNKDKNLRVKLAQNAYNYAQKNFSYENFYRAYRKIILADG